MKNNNTILLYILMKLLKIFFVNISDEGLHSYYYKIFNNIEDAENFYNKNYEAEEVDNTESIINLHTGIFVVINDIVEYYDSDSYEWNTKNQIFGYLRDKLNEI